MERIPIVIIVILLGLAAILWIDLRRESRRLFLHIILCVYVLGILYFTLISRQPTGNNRVNFVLFYSFYRSLKYPLHPRSMLKYLLSGQYDLVFTTLKPMETALLNILLFIPAGYILPLYVKKRKSKIEPVITITIIFSLCIEITQTITSLGWFDIDDLFCNFVGSMIGFMLYKIGHGVIIIGRKQDERKNNGHEGDSSAV